MREGDGRTSSSLASTTLTLTSSSSEDGNSSTIFFVPALNVTFPVAAAPFPPTDVRFTIFFSPDLPQFEFSENEGLSHKHGLVGRRRGREEGGWGLGTAHCDNCEGRGGGAGGGTGFDSRRGRRAGEGRGRRRSGLVELEALAEGH